MNLNVKDHRVKYYLPAIITTGFNLTNILHSKTRQRTDKLLLAWTLSTEVKTYTDIYRVLACRYLSVGIAQKPLKYYMAVSQSMRIFGDQISHKFTWQKINLEVSRVWNANVFNTFRSFWGVFYKMLNCWHFINTVDT